MTALVSPQDALVYVMVTASVADSTVKAAEADAISGIIHALPVFAGYDENRVRASVSACNELLSSEEGIDAILGIVEEALPKSLYETAYALAVEISASDSKVMQAELVFLEMLADRLEIPKLSIAAIEYSARVRFRSK